MRLYTASTEETLRARRLLKDWAGEGFLTKEQYQRLEQETASELRTTNIFLRLILFLFTLISVGAAAALFVKVFLPGPSEQTTGIFLLIFAAVCYAAPRRVPGQVSSEQAVAQAKVETMYMNATPPTVASRVRRDGWCACASGRMSAVAR